MKYQAVLLDVDGTLVDTAYLHTVAWSLALADAGCPRPMSDIHPLIGMGSSELLSELLGHDDSSISGSHGDHFASMHSWIRPLPGARRLVSALHGAGRTVVLATSAKQRDLPALLGALDADDAIDHVVSGEEVAGAKPAPDLFTAALAQAGVGPDRAVAVGDAVWDVVAAGQAGLPCIGLLTGGIDAGRLDQAGALAVFRSCQELYQSWPDGVLTEPGEG